MIDQLHGIVTADEQQQQITDETLPDRPTIAQIARWLGKSRNTVYYWASNGLIPCRKIKRSYIFDKRALLEWAKPQKEAA